MIYKERIISLAIVSIIVLSAATVFIPERIGGTVGTTRYVGGSGSGNYTRIQSAIDDASDGDTVFVYDGLYYETLVIDRAITLLGENRNSTIIQGGNTSNAVVNITSHQVHLSGFTITAHGSNARGIFLISSHNIIMGNAIINNNESGIDLWSSNNNTIQGNTITNNKNGIWLSSSNHNDITVNTITGNTVYGIRLDYPSNNNAIIENSIATNTLDGIYILSSGNTIMQNTIISNNRYGIWLDHSNNNTIPGNTITNNSCGIYLTITVPSSNKIYHNNFINNEYHAYGYGTSYWDNGYPSGGNYWDNYTGVDTNDDHIGDAPYSISGGNNTDRYPLVMPYTVTGNQLPIANFTYSHDGYIVTFTDTSADPDGNITSWHWDFGDQTSSITSSPTHEYLEKGNYTVTFTVTDNDGGSDSFTQVITVEKGDGDEEDGNIPGFEMLLLVIAVISLLIVIGRRSK